MNSTSSESGAESQADQDWLEAEREIRNDQAGKTKVAPTSS